jgi:hypothetical protein
MKGWSMCVVCPHFQFIHTDAHGFREEEGVDAPADTEDTPCYSFAVFGYLSRNEMVLPG